MRDSNSRCVKELLMRGRHSVHQGGRVHGHSSKGRDLRSAESPDAAPAGCWDASPRAARAAGAPAPSTPGRASSQRRRCLPLRRRWHHEQQRERRQRPARRRPAAERTARPPRRFRPTAGCPEAGRPAPGPPGLKKATAARCPAGALCTWPTCRVNYDSLSGYVPYGGTTC